MASRLCGIFLLVFFCAPAIAQSTKPASTDAFHHVPISNKSGTPASTQSTGILQSSTAEPQNYQRIVIALLIVVGVIIGAHRIWKKMGSPGGGNSTGNSLQVISRLTVSPRQQVMLIRVGRRCVLVGNSGTQMNALSEITDPDEVAVLLGQTGASTPQTTAAAFNEVLDGAETNFDQNCPPVDDLKSEVREEEAALLNTREELSGMMNRIRNLSQQFKPKPDSDNPA